MLVYKVLLWAVLKPNKAVMALRNYKDIWKKQSKNIFQTERWYSFRSPKGAFLCSSVLPRAWPKMGVNVQSSDVINQLATILIFFSKKCGGSGGGGARGFLSFWIETWMEGRIGDGGSFIGASGATAFKVGVPTGAWGWPSSWLPSHQPSLLGSYCNARLWT